MVHGDTNEGGSDRLHDFLEYRVLFLFAHSLTGIFPPTLQDPSSSEQMSYRRFPSIITTQGRCELIKPLREPLIANLPLSSSSQSTHEPFPAHLTVSRRVPKPGTKMPCY